MKEIVKIRREKLFQEIIAKGKTTDRMIINFLLLVCVMEGKPMKYIILNIQYKC